MKPYVICHMKRERRRAHSRQSMAPPAENCIAGLFNRLHEQLGGGSWLTGAAGEGKHPSTGDALETFSMSIPVAGFVAVH
jgi:hypothetical protein